LTTAWPHERLIRAVCERVGGLSRLVRAAVAAVDLRGVYRPTPKFGPYLRVAFPAGPPGSGEGTAEQRAFARAIADRDELWDGTYYGVAEMFDAAAVPSARRVAAAGRAADRRHQLRVRAAGRLRDPCGGATPTHGCTWM
jgi:hypothetical protein